MKIPVILMCKIFTLIVCDSRYKIYYDNGLDTETNYITNDEKVKLEEQMLALFNMKKRPEYITSGLNRSNVRFLINIYNKYAKQDKIRVKRSSQYVTEESYNKLYESEVIVTSEIVRITETDKFEKTFYFKPKVVQSHNSILAAVFRLYKSPAENNINDKYSIHASEVLKTIKGKRRLQKVFWIDIPENRTGWLNFNITKCVRNWIHQPGTNKGIAISIYRKNDLREVSFEEAGVVYDGNEEFAPFLVTFMNGDNVVNGRSIRASEKSVDSYDYQRSMNELLKEYRLARQCKLFTMYIYFKELRWQDWIIAPTGYAAHYCQGECNFPLNGPTNATNHAIVQSLAHILNSGRFPKPCCAPNKLSSISVLYFADNSNVLLKKYDKMMVESCGCH